jgi:hypothetical protein
LQTNKVEAYLGFCIRAGKLTTGVNAALCLKKEVYLLIADRAVAKNSWKEILKLKGRFSCPLVLVDELEELVHKPHCKLVAVRDKSLADAIYALRQSGEITEYIGGNEQ